MSKTQIQTGAVTHDLVDTIRSIRRTGVPMLVFGPPGIGKSQQVHQAADGDPVIDIRLSMLDPVDLRGLPIVRDERVLWARPDFLPEDGKGILLFDELNTAPIAVQNAALQLILDRRCGPHRLGDGWYIVACGNRASHRAHVNPLSAPLRNRFAIVEYEPTVERWSSWAYAHGVHDHVIAFLNFSPSHLIGDPGDEYANFASPRAWERVSRFLHAGIDDVDAVTSLVGRGGAVAFDAYRQEIGSMPDIGDLLDGETEWSPTAERLSVSFAVAVALASHLLRSRDGQTAPRERVERACALAATLPPEVTCVFALACMAGPAHLKSMFLLSKGMLDFCTKHKALIARYGGSLGDLAAKGG